MSVNSILILDSYSTANVGDVIMVMYLPVYIQNG